MNTTINIEKEQEEKIILQLIQCVLIDLWTSDNFTINDLTD